MKFFVILLLSLPTFFSCSSPSVVKADPHSRKFENVAKGDLFRAIKAVLQNEGTIIRRQNPYDGFVSVAIEKTTRRDALFENLVGSKSDDDEDLREEFEFYVVIGKQNKANSWEVRASLQKSRPSLLAGKTGMEIDVTEVYTVFFDKLERKVAANRLK